MADMKMASTFSSPFYECLSTRLPVGIEGNTKKSTENYSTPGTNMRTMKSSPHNYRGDADTSQGFGPIQHTTKSTTKISEKEQRHITDRRAIALYRYATSNT
ncbi:hypothetical protein DPMN_100417 [Dreissena polymorpha]|uniref:Uncharacterized protein n=1 Tax=Dreissena polymorpha TaxID=45954 RepID=A0A9D4LI68_DREPO|nr:hypothetical protein DPMN_100417 [Dreissena polymorpha]